MGNSSILLRVYNDFTSERLNTSNPDDKVIMQKIVFLLNELGLVVGDYKFSWDKYGPFSQSLHNDIALISEEDVAYDGEFSSYAQSIIDYAKNIFKKWTETNYSGRNWIETVSSIVFLKRYEYPSLMWEDIITKLVELKSYLNNEEGNLKALECSKAIIDYES